MTDAALFGLELRRARERRSVSLDQLAEATKISASLFAGLERGDLARWPNGIFRRAFLRSYAEAVGLDPDEILARFLRIYPDTEGAAAPSPAPLSEVAEPAEAELRLVLDEASAAPRSTGAWRTARRIAAPLFDLVLAGVPAVAVSLIFGWQWFFGVAAGVGLVGHLLTLALVGATPGAWLLLPRPAKAPRPTGSETQARRRPDAETAPAAPAPRRRQPRHASGSASRPIPAGRTRRVQH